MITFTSGAEYHFKQLLESLGADRDQWRLYHFRISSVQRGVSKKEAAKVAFNIIQSFIKEEEGAVFFLEDGDIIVLYNGRVQAVMEEMAYQLQYLFAENINGEHAQDFMRLIHLGTHLDQAKSLAEQKIKTTLNLTVENTPTTPTEQVNHLLPNEEERKIFQLAASKRHGKAEKSILIVEDDPLSLRLVKNVLQNEYKIITAATGQEAFDMYTRQAPHIVFLDIGLPDTSGLQILEKILILDPSAYIIMLSGHTYQEAIMQAMKSGARGFVGKPFTRERLIRYITSVNN
jgi:two-component system chemotaxis response regulator CheY